MDVEEQWKLRRLIRSWEREALAAYQSAFDDRHIMIDEDAIGESRGKDECAADLRRFLGLKPRRRRKDDPK